MSYFTETLILSHLLAGLMGALTTMALLTLSQGRKVKRMENDL